MTAIEREIMVDAKTSAIQTIRAPCLVVDDFLPATVAAQMRDAIGGETIVLHEGDLFRRHVATPQAGRGLFDAIEPRFNRLVVFDDRLVHGVERVDGSMDPVEGRFVLHGHLRADGPMI